MKKILSLALAIALVMLALCFTAIFPLGISAATDRTGWTAISSASDFAAITSGTSSAVKKYYLTKDITVNATINSGWNGAAISYIELDGNGKTITLSKPLFNRFGKGVTIHDLDLAGKIVWTGSFMKSPLTSGHSENSDSVVNIYNLNSDVDMEVSFNNRWKRFSGVIHLTGTGSTLTNVKYTGSITVKPTEAGDAKIEDVGGLVGTAKGTVFTDCTNYANILIMNGVTPGKTDGGAPVSGTAAGIAGETSNCSFINCTNNGDITIENCGYYTAGGIAGTVSGVTVMTNCTNTGDITSQSCSNGLAGCKPYRIEKTNCVNTGKISQTYTKVEKVKGSCDVMEIEEHYTCLSCGALYDKFGESLSISDILGDYEHDLGELIPEKKADCQSAGMKAHYRCEDCDSYFDENKNETLELFLVTEAGHTLVKLNAGEIDCAFPKVKTDCYLCIVCETYFDKDMKPIDENDVIESEALGHDYGELIAEVGAKVGVAGMKAHYECSRCHALFDTEKNEVESDALTIPALEPEAPKDDEGEKPDEPKDPEGDEPDEPEGNNKPKPEESKPTDKQTDATEPESEAPSGALPVDKEESGGCSAISTATPFALLLLLGGAITLTKKKEN